MTITEDARAILQAAVDRKVSAVDTYAVVRAQREQAAATLRAAEAAEADAWAELKRLDWSDSELRSLGLSAPAAAGERRSAVRRRNRQPPSSDALERA